MPPGHALDCRVTGPAVLVVGAGHFAALRKRSSAVGTDMRTVPAAVPLVVAEPSNGTFPSASPWMCRIDTELSG